MNTALIYVIGFLGMLLIGAFLAITLLVPGDKTIAYVGLGVVAGLFIPQLMTFKSSSDNAAKLAVVDNTLAAATVQQAHALEGINQKVDGNLTGMREEQRASNVMIATLIKQVASLEKDKAVKEVVDAHAESSEKRIIDVVTAAVAAVALPSTEITPPPDEPRARPGEHS